MNTKRVTPKKAKKSSTSLTRARVRRAIAEVYAKKDGKENLPKFTEVIVTNKHVPAHASH